MRLISVLDELDEKILNLLKEGYAPKEIAHKLWKSKATIHYRLHQLRKHFKCKTTYELISNLSKNLATPQVE